MYCFCKCFQNFYISCRPVTLRRSRCWQMFFKISVLKNFGIFTKNTSVGVVFLIKFSPATLLKGDCNTGAFREYCKNFKKNFFYKTPQVTASFYLKRILPRQFFRTSTFQNTFQQLLQPTSKI